MRLKFKKMNVQFKFFLSVAVASSVLFGQVAMPTYASSSVEETIKLQGTELIWNTNETGQTLEKVLLNDQEIVYSYNSNNNRVSKKIPDDIVNYTYNQDSQLISESNSNQNIQFTYDESTALIDGLIVEENVYHYIKDDDLNVIAINDSEGNEVAKYQYDTDGKTLYILGQDSNGKWIDRSEDTEFIGVINPIRLHSLYYDAETGWYYNGRQYYDSVNNKYIVGTDHLRSMTDDSVSAMASDNMAIRIHNWRTNLMNSSDFGKSISYSSKWYDNLSDVELLSRLIYGENTVLTADQNAVAWVLINRKNQNSSVFGGSTYRGVATKSGAFEPLTGGSSGTTNARVPNTSSPRWSNAVWIACTLLTTSSTADYNEFITKPTGISNQLYFVGLSYFLTGVSQDKSPTGSGIKYSFNGGSTFVDIKDIVVVFDTTDVFQNPTSRSAITSNSRLNTAAKRNSHNIFFNTK
ncbi:hypothetical protein [Paenibacillus amylolyticus]|uniref:hypothetical protein n=1 Tax=Paenibacillus amylolyticus TaxID=1451 RepID=UPI003EB7847D